MAQSGNRFCRALMMAARWYSAPALSSCSTKKLPKRSIVTPGRPSDSRRSGGSCRGHRARPARHARFAPAADGVQRRRYRWLHCGRRSTRGRGSATTASKRRGPAIFPDGQRYRWFHRCGLYLPCGRRRRRISTDGDAAGISRVLWLTLSGGIGNLSWGYL